MIFTKLPHEQRPWRAGLRKDIQTVEAEIQLNPMNENPLNKGMIEVNSDEIGEISEEMIAKRAGELALIAGRPVNGEDGEQAVRELTGGVGMDDEQAMLESIPEDERWDPIHGSTGQQVGEPASETEDEDGRGRNAQLFEEGVREAAHDQMLQAATVAEEHQPTD